MALKRSPRAGTNKDDSPAPQRIATAGKQLAGISIDAKAAVDELCANIAPLEAALEKFNLGVSAWFTITGSERDDGSYWSREIGYAQIGKKWGIALKRVEGHHAADYDNEEIWLFKDAPKWLQIEGVTKIPDLFEALLTRAQDTIEKLKAKSQKAKELTEALNAALAEVATDEREGW